MLLVKNLEKAQGIYVITQISTGMKYVGKSVNIKCRIKSHIRDNVQAIQKAITEFGMHDFVVEARYFPNLLHDELVDLEYETIKDENSMKPNGYNAVCRGSTNIISKETREKLSNALKGKPFSKDHKRKLSIAWRNRGVVTDETRQKMSNAKVGVKKSSETRKNMSRAQRGKVVSPEARKKISEAKRVNYTFNNSKTNETFIGMICELSIKFDLNPRSAEARFYSGRSHKGWIRLHS